MSNTDEKAGASPRTNCQACGCNGTHWDWCRVGELERELAAKTEELRVAVWAVVKLVEESPTVVNFEAWDELSLFVHRNSADSTVPNSNSVPHKLLEKYIARSLYDDMKQVAEAAIKRAESAERQLELANQNCDLIGKNFDHLAAAVGWSKERCEQDGDSPFDCVNELKQQLSRAREETREACAKICDEYALDAATILLPLASAAGRDCANKVRALALPGHTTTNPNDGEFGLPIEHRSAPSTTPGREGEKG